MVLITLLRTDLLKENQKIILGLVWSLIRHYQINKGLKGLQSNEDPVLESMLAGPSAQTQTAKPPIKKWTRVKVDPPPTPPTPPPHPPVNFYLTANDEDNPPPPPPPPPLPPYVVFEEVEVVTIEPTVTPAPTTNAKNTVSGSTAVKKNDKSGDNTRTVLLREVQRRLAPDHTDLVANDFSSRYFTVITRKLYRSFSNIAVLQLCRWTCLLCPCSSSRSTPDRLQRLAIRMYFKNLL
jgi:hypothetical protein